MDAKAHKGDLKRISSFPKMREQHRHEFRTLAHPIDSDIDTSDILKRTAEDCARAAELPAVRTPRNQQIGQGVDVDALPCSAKRRLRLLRLARSDLARGDTARSTGKQTELQTGRSREARSRRR